MKSPIKRHADVGAPILFCVVCVVVSIVLMGLLSKGDKKDWEEKPESTISEPEIVPPRLLPIVDPNQGTAMRIENNIAKLEDLIRDLKSIESELHDGIDEACLMAATRSVNDAIRHLNYRIEELSEDE